MKEDAYLDHKKTQLLKYARDIKDKINQLNINLDKNIKRIFWELTQNANDSKKEGNLEIEVFLTKKSFIFSHNGDPFTSSNINGLIYQKTTKERLEEKKLNSDSELDLEELLKKIQTTGKYGTGFQVSYLLSRLIHIKGIVKYKNTFREFFLEIDRTSNDNQILGQRIDYSFNSVYDNASKNPSTENYSDFGLNDCNTSFEYIFQDSNGLKNAISILENLDISLPYVFSFIKKLKKITIYNDLEKTTVVYNKILGRKFKKHSQLIKLQKIINNKEEEFRYIIRIRSSGIRLAKEIFSSTKDNKDDKDFYIKPKDDKVPTFFVDFPLIGSEKYKFPFVIQSHLFNPMECRSDIFLDNINEEADFNKKLLINVVKLYKYVFRDLRELNGVEFLVDMDFGNDWFFENIELQIGDLLKEEFIIPLCNGDKECFNNLKCFNSLKINQIMENFYDNTLLSNKEFHYWKTILQRRWFNYSFLNIQDVFKNISGLKNINNLKEYFPSKSEKEAIFFLNKFYYLHNNQSFQNLKYEEIFPNKNGELKKLKNLSYNEEEDSTILEDVLFVNENIPNEINVIVQKFCNYNIDDILINDNINIFWNMEKKSTLDLIDIINTNLKKTKNREFVFELTKLTIKDCDERNEIFEVGEMFYKFEKKEININISNLWKISDIHFIEYLINDMIKLNSMNELNNQTGNQTSSIHFLKSFHLILQKKNYLKYSKLPNMENELLPLKDLLKFNLEDGLINNFDDNDYPTNIFDILLGILKLMDREKTQKFIHNEFLDFAPNNFGLQNTFDSINRFIFKNRNNLKTNPNNKIIIKELLKLEKYDKFLQNIPYFCENKENLILTGIFTEDEKKEVINLMKDEIGVEIIKNYKILNEDEKKQYSKITREDLKLLRE